MVFHRSTVILAMIAGFCGALLAQQTEQAKRSASETHRVRRASTAVADGQREFEARCSGCHGLDGRGGERAPNIATNSATQQHSDIALFNIIHDGIAAKGMPGFGILGNDKLNLIVNYLRYLGGRGGRAASPGNPIRGEALFFGKAECANCHMMRGKGGYLGPDLTEYAQAHAPRALKEAILNPGQTHGRGGELVEVLSRSGERLSGIIRNEDNFSLQLLGTDGAFHLLMKSEIERLDRCAGPIMPADYGRRLSVAELQDLVSYITAAGVVEPYSPKGKNGSSRR